MFIHVSNSYTDLAKRYVYKLKGVHKYFGNGTF